MRLTIPSRVDLLAEVLRLREINTRLGEENRRLVADNDALRAQVAALMARVEELERKLGRNSQNSSRPPSSDPPGAPRPPKKEATGRKPGGQPGHEGHERALLPPEKVDKVEEIWPARCESCRHELCGEELKVEVGEPVRRQVTELPVAPAEVTEYRMHTHQCPRCAQATTAELPAGIPQGSFGPRLQAFAATLSGVYKLSKRPLRSLLGDVFGVEMSLGAIVACDQRTSAALAAPVEEAHAYAQEQPIAGADETGWRERRGRAWVWVMVTAQVTVFMIHARRGTLAAQKLLGRFRGILVTDRWSAYAGHLLRKRQLCWAHFKRHFEGWAEYDGKAGEVGRWLVIATEELFKWWHWTRDGTWSRSYFQKRVVKLRRDVRRLLRDGLVCGRGEVEGTCRQLLALEPAMWTFVRVPGVEPTNNASERAIRPAVLRRKISFGTHSEDGSRFVERMLTVAATLKQQRRNVYEYVAESCERALDGRRPRSLLPGGRVMSAAASAVSGA